MPRLFVVIFLLNFFYFISSTCPKNSFEYQSNCYIYNSTVAGFAAAEIYCTQIGGHLASIHDAFTNVVIGQEASNYLHESTVSDLWIGATTLLTNGKWNWTDGSGFDFTDWKQKEPQNVSDSNCASMSLTDDFWTSQNCNELKPFVCQISSSFNTTPTYPLTANCSQGWSYFAPTHSCYGVNYAGFIDVWSTAEAYCQQNGAHLPSFHSYAEYQYLTSYFYYAWSYDQWTGIYSPDSGSTWRTSDGTPADFLKYASWCSGHPANISGESCVALADTCVFAINCTNSPQRTLCKKILFD